jgi:signal transduction histidine kinase
MIGEDSYFAVSFTDVSDVVKKRILERLFFHDIINTAGALQGLLELLMDEVPEKVRPDLDFVTRTFRFLNDDILAQKQLTNAENNELSLRPEELDSMAILKSVVKLYEEHEAAVEKRIVIVSCSENIELRSDAALLRRVIGNMLKNALEASAAGMTVEMGCEKQGETVRFWVRNDAYMEPIIQHGIFMRSVSTKGAGRGLGTYSIKLLGEKYLKGKVGFKSSRQEGTTFFINVPVEIQGTARGLS